MRFTRTLTITNLLIGSTALGFQVTVLYPWHHELQADFDKMKAEHVRALHEARAASAAELRNIHQQLAELRLQRRWFW
ncbi:hypothetical protein EJ06DRAFT_256065 [Trichodelitschia bisporula]|uniref:Uncharacterized protein n=1 Tax=Trichodelitschia bisporula TaxID=703511 RepID=A0A6G1HJ92_9PEZI|nr:hypothetical protein EJ06DRAFT_256065 [Trichodelitschia bisporula]